MPDSVDLVKAHGHEIGCHSYSHAQDKALDVLSYEEQFDVIRLINEGDIEQMCILAHPERWSDSFGAWLKELMWQNVKNVGKVILVKRRGRFKDKGVKVI